MTFLLPLAPAVEEIDKDGAAYIYAVDTRARLRWRVRPLRSPYQWGFVPLPSPNCPTTRREQLLQAFFGSYTKPVHGA